MLHQALVRAVPSIHSRAAAVPAAVGAGLPARRQTRLSDSGLVQCGRSTGLHFCAWPVQAAASQAPHSNSAAALEMGRRPQHPAGISVTRESAPVPPSSGPSGLGPARTAAGGGRGSAPTPEGTLFRGRFSWSGACPSLPASASSPPQEGRRSAGSGGDEPASRPRLGFLSPEWGCLAPNSRDAG